MTTHTVILNRLSDEAPDYLTMNLGNREIRITTHASKSKFFHLLKFLTNGEISVTTFHNDEVQDLVLSIEEALSHIRSEGLISDNSFIALEDSEVFQKFAEKANEGKMEDDSEKALLKECGLEQNSYYYYSPPHYSNGRRY